jgi:hypothetical protein
MSAVAVTDEALLRGFLSILNPEELIATEHNMNIR